MATPVSLFRERSTCRHANRLSAVPELMALAAGRFESFLPQLEVAYE